jgi:hypothetical protein
MTTSIATKLQEIDINILHLHSDNINTFLKSFDMDSMCVLFNTGNNTIEVKTDSVEFCKTINTLTGRVDHSATTTSIIINNNGNGANTSTSLNVSNICTINDALLDMITVSNLTQSNCTASCSDGCDLNECDTSCADYITERNNLYTTTSSTTTPTTNTPTMNTLSSTTTPTTNTLSSTPTTNTLSSTTTQDKITNNYIPIISGLGGDRKITLSWSAPPSNINIRNYVILAFETNNHDAGIRAEISSSNVCDNNTKNMSGCYYTMTGLENNIYYTLGISSIMTDGVSTMSNTLNIKPTHIDIPNVTNLRREASLVISENKQLVSEIISELRKRDGELSKELIKRTENSAILEQRNREIPVGYNCQFNSLDNKTIELSLSI